jgi:RNA polymerase Rpb1, domain 5/LAGLIDADG-like domain/RNA polymerase Rpb1, domain 4
VKVAVEQVSVSTAGSEDGLLVLKDKIKLDENFGYLIGAAAGNGWVIHAHDSTKGFAMAGSCVEMQDKVESIIQSIFLGQAPEASKNVEKAEDRNGHGISTRVSYSSKNLGENFERWIGAGARSKHLPEFIFVAPVKFILGVFAGLMDTDGSVSVANSVGKNKPQLMASYYTTSLRLAQEVRLLASTLGIAARVTPTHTPAGLESWYVGLSGPDVQEWNGRGMVHPGKLSSFGSVEPISRTSPSVAKTDIVPIPTDLAHYLSKFIKVSVDASLYNTLRKTKHSPSISRISAERVVDLARDKIKDHPLGKRWLEVLSAKVIWDPVVDVRRGGTKTGYDLTVPGYETFMDVDGVILSNTMSVHVPVLDGAVEEAKRMFPSRNIYSPGTGSLMLEPRQEALVGLSLLSKDPTDKNPKASLKNIDEVEIAINRGALKYNDVIELGGESTTAGRALINRHLPVGIKLDSELDKTTASKLYRDIAEKNKDGYANIIDRLRQLGDTHAYRSGFSVSLADAEPDLPEKDQVFREAHAQVAAFRRTDASQEAVDDNVKKVFGAAEKKVRGILESRLKQQGNRFNTMVTTGARGNMTQLMQIVSAPVLVRDHRGNTIPTPITTSYSKGMPLSDYWVTLYGARAGAMDRQLQTSKPGAFTKDVMAAAVSNLISKEDCGDDRGLTFDLKRDRDLREVNDRFLAQDVLKDGKTYAHHNDLITPKLTADLLKHGVTNINVRSPLTCLSPHGICALDYGLHEDGRLPQVGDNIGAISGQAMSEPLTQLTMSTFHSGSVAGAGLKLSTFDKIDRLMSLRKRLPGKATLADVAGRVDSIHPSTTKGGNNVLIGGVEHFVPKSLPMLVRVGSNVGAGDAISEGIISPQELLDRKKELLPALEYMAKEVTNAYQSERVPLRQRAVETVVRTIGSLTKIVDPGSSPYAPGELAPYQAVQAFNRTTGHKAIGEALGHILVEDSGPVKAGTKIDKNVQKILASLGKQRVKVGPDPIIHEPQIFGIKALPLMRSDWMSQLGYNHIKDALLGGTANRSESDVHGYSPIPAFAYGAEFGQGEGGSY